MNQDLSVDEVLRLTGDLEALNSQMDDICERSKASDDWLCVLLIAFRLNRDFESCIRTSLDNYKRVLSRKDLSYELGLTYWGIRWFDSATTWIINCIGRWPDDVKFYGLLLDYLMANVAKDCRVDMSLSSSFDLASVSCAGVRGLIRELIHEPRMAAEELEEGFKAHQIDTYLNYLALTCELVTPYIDKLPNTHVQQAEALSNHERIFRALISVRQSEIEKARELIRNVRPAELWSHDIFICLPILIAIRDKKIARPFIHNYAPSPRANGYGLSMCSHLAQVVGDAKLLRFVESHIAKGRAQSSKEGG